MQLRRYQSNMSRPILRVIWNTINQMERERSSSITLGGGVIRIKEVDAVEVVGGVIQMVVEVVVVAAAEEEVTQMAATNIMTSLEIIIQGTIITTEDVEVEVVATTATMVQVVKLIMLQVMLGCNLDKL